MAHQSLVASFPDTQTRTDDLIAEGDRVVERWTNWGTHTGASFMNTPATGKKFNVSGISIYRIANGKIVEHWGEFDFVLSRVEGGNPTAAQGDGNRFGA
jgi:predicted ester cyclase